MINGAVLSKWTPLGFAGCSNQRACAELLIDAGAKLHHIEDDIPHWMQALVTKRANFKRGWMALFTCLFKRNMNQESNERNFIVQKDIARVICSLVHQSRFDEQWMSLVDEGAPLK